MSCHCNKCASSRKESSVSHKRNSSKEESDKHREYHDFSESKSSRHEKSSKSSKSRDSRQCDKCSNFNCICEDLHQCNDCANHNCHQRNDKQCNKCFRDNCACVEYFSCLRVKCGVVSASLEKSASPSFYTEVGQIITYTYTITNTGTVPICYPIQICDDKLGGQIIPYSNIYPGLSQSFTRPYAITANDLLQQSITNTATACIIVKCKKWVCTDPTSATITFGNADVLGTITQTLVEDNIGSVIITISNSTLSETSAFGVNLFLPYPAGVTAGNVIPSLAIAPASAIVVGPLGLTIAEAVIPAANTYQYRFTYTPGAPGAFQWAGIINTASFDPDLSNNALSSILIIP